MAHATTTRTARRPWAGDLIADSAGGRSERADDDHVGAALSQLCVAAGDRLGLPGVVVMVMSSGPTDTDTAVVGWSSEAGRSWADIQLSVGEGPCRDAFDSGRPVLAPHVAAELGRWPGYAVEAARTGVGAVFAFPVQLGAVRFGVLACYADQPRSLTGAEMGSLLGVADDATSLLLGLAGDASIEALHVHTEVYQAQGMVMVQLDVGLAEALARMRAHAFAHSQSLATVAAHIVAGTIALGGTDPDDPGDGPDPDPGSGPDTEIEEP